MQGPALFLVSQVRRRLHGIVYLSTLEGVEGYGQKLAPRAETRQACHFLVTQK